MLNSCHRLRRKTSGFTLIELLVVVSLVGIMATIAAPAFTGMIATTRVKGAASNLHMALLKARSEAVKRNASVRVVRNNPDWNAGWQVLDASNNVLGTEAALVGATISTTAPATITYMRSGRVQGNLQPAFTVDTAKATHCRQVSVGLGGMSTIETFKRVDCP